jgi:hypothetical protein
MDGLRGGGEEFWGAWRGVSGRLSGVRVCEGQESAFVRGRCGGVSSCVVGGC